MMKPQKEIAILQAVYDGANVYEMQAANYLRQVSKLYDKSLVTITNNDDMHPNAPYFYAKLTPQGRTYLALLRSEHANNRASTGRVGL